MILAGNEVGEMWRKMLTYLKQAWPILSKQQENYNEEVQIVNLDIDDSQHSSFVFISDCDKEGLNS